AALCVRVRPAAAGPELSSSGEDLTSDWLGESNGIIELKEPKGCSRDLPDSGESKSLKGCHHSDPNKPGPAPSQGRRTSSSSRNVMRRSPLRAGSGPRRGSGTSFTGHRGGKAQPTGARLAAPRSQLMPPRS